MKLIKNARSPFWWFDFYFEGTRYRGSTGEKSKSVAGTVAAAHLTRLTEGNTITKRGHRAPTLRDFSKRFLTWAENSSTLKPNSRRYYVYGWRLLSFTVLASMPIDQITAETIDVITFRRPVIDRRTGRDSGMLANCSRAYTNQALRTLKVMLGKAEEWKVLGTRNSFTIPDAPGRQTLIDQDADIRLEQQFYSPTAYGKGDIRRRRAWLVTVMIQDAGMRPNEIFPMRIEQIRWDADAIWIPDGKTSNAKRWVGMSERMKMLLREWIGDRTEGWLMPSSRSASGHIESIYGSFRTARKGAGLDQNIVPYSGRHTYGTYQMGATGNVFAVSRAMGHAGVKSMEPYQHPDTAGLNIAIDKRNRERNLRRFEMLSEVGHISGHTTGLVQ